MSKLVPQIIKMLDDQNASVRDQAMTTLIEVYRHVGERFRLDISKDINPAKLSTLLTRMDDIRSAGLVLVSNCSAGAINEETFVRSFEDVSKIYISSAKDVSERMSRIRDTLSDKNADCMEKRTDVMKELRGLLLAGAPEYAGFEQLLPTLEPCLTMSVKDLRSQVIREV